MTGYPREEVIGFNCRFLQGKKKKKKNKAKKQNKQKKKTKNKKQKQKTKTKTKTKTKQKRERKKKTTSKEKKMASIDLFSAEVFTELLNDTNGINQFQKFLSSQSSDNVIRFWKACEEFKNKEVLDKKSLGNIYFEYIHDGGDSQVDCIPETLRNETIDKMKDPTTDMFDHCQEYAFQSMLHDSYKRFIYLYVAKPNKPNKPNNRIIRQVWITETETVTQPKELFFCFVVRFG